MRTFSCALMVLLLLTAVDATVVISSAYEWRSLTLRKTFSLIRDSGTAAKKHSKHVMRCDEAEECFAHAGDRREGKYLEGGKKCTMHCHGDGTLFAAITYECKLNDYVYNRQQKGRLISLRPRHYRYRFTRL